MLQVPSKSDEAGRLLLERVLSPSCAEKYCFDAPVIYQVLNSCFKVTMHGLKMQAIASVHVPNKLTDLAEVIRSVKEESEHTCKPCAAQRGCFSS